MAILHVGGQHDGRMLDEVREDYRFISSECIAIPNDITLSTAHWQLQQCYADMRVTWAAMRTLIEKHNGTDLKELRGVIEKVSKLPSLAPLLLAELTLCRTKHKVVLIGGEKHGHVVQLTPDDKYFGSYHRRPELNDWRVMIHTSLTIEQALVLLAEKYFEDSSN